MTAMPDDADSCVRHQCERGGEDEERRGSFFCARTRELLSILA